ncbi:hypothetical protein CLV67_10824 [Actinoplanes italicus]|uniref:Uncharacterized protein n=1 Tax=Actinoplanes italicus TaxID=113567 RepID=A0A2T0KAP3_9ACTN|nr:hypothetical protein CLV67_10824 [Actinoplanes italicus]
MPTALSSSSSFFPASVLLSGCVSPTPLPCVVLVRQFGVLAAPAARGVQHGPVAVTLDADGRGGDWLENRRSGRRAAHKICEGRCQTVAARGLPGPPPTRPAAWPRRAVAPPPPRPPCRAVPCPCRAAVPRPAPCRAPRRAPCRAVPRAVPCPVPCRAPRRSARRSARRAAPRAAPRRAPRRAARRAVPRAVPCPAPCRAPRRAAPRAVPRPAPRRAAAPRAGRAGRAGPRCHQWGRSCEVRPPSRPEPHYFCRQVGGAAERRAILCGYAVPATTTSQDLAGGDE